MAVQTLLVSLEVQDDIDILADCLNEAFGEMGWEDTSVNVAKPSQEGLTAGQMTASIILVCVGNTSLWFSKKWVDTYVWPKIQKRIDKPSQKLVDWMFHSQEVDSDSQEQNDATQR